MKRFILLASILFIMLPISAKANLIENSGFENSVYTIGFNNSTPGIWFGDSTQTVSSETGITPFQGLNMLNFVNSSPTGPSATTWACDVWQLIELSNYSAAIASGNAVIAGSAYFNRVIAPEEGTGTLFGMDVYSFSGSLSNFYSQVDQKTYFASSTIYLDNDTLTWEQVSLSAGLPIGTDYIGLHLYALKNAVGIEFPGNYADNITLDIGSGLQETAPVPEPTTLLLLGSGLMGIAGIRKKFKKS